MCIGPVSTSSRNFLKGREKKESERKIIITVRFRLDFVCEEGLYIMGDRGRPRGDQSSQKRKRTSTTPPGRVTEQKKPKEGGSQQSATSTHPFARFPFPFHNPREASALPSRAAAATAAAARAAETLATSGPPRTGRPAAVVPAAGTAEAIGSRDRQEPRWRTGVSSALLPSTPPICAPVFPPTRVVRCCDARLVTGFCTRAVLRRVPNLEKGVLGP